MTKAELVAALEGMPDDAEVKVFDAEYGHYEPIEQVSRFNKLIALNPPDYRLPIRSYDVLDELEDNHGLLWTGVSEPVSMFEWHKWLTMNQILAVMQSIDAELPEEFAE